MSRFPKWNKRLIKAILEFKECQINNDDYNRKILVDFNKMNHYLKNKPNLKGQSGKIQIPWYS